MLLPGSAIFSTPLGLWNRFYPDPNRPQSLFILFIWAGRPYDKRLPLWFYHIKISYSTTRINLSRPELGQKSYFYRLPKFEGGILNMALRGRQSCQRTNCTRVPRYQSNLPVSGTVSTKIYQRTDPYPYSCNVCDTRSCVWHTLNLYGYGGRS